MFNTFIFNSRSYNAIDPNSVAVMKDGQIFFEGFELQSAEVVSSTVNTLNAPLRSYKTAEVPRGDGQVELGDGWNRKQIAISGVFRANTPQELVEKLDRMKQILSTSKGQLDVSQFGQMRRYTCTWINPDSSFSSRTHSNITFQPYTLNFAVDEPFGRAMNVTAKSLFDQTDLTLGEQINNTGTAQSRPVVIVQIQSATDLAQITFSNATSGQQLSITRSFAAGDIIEIDSDKRRVRVNSINTDFDGAFAHLVPGANQVQITLDATAATYDVTLKHYKRYL